MAETKPASNQKLRYERERRAWSQQDVADRVGTTPLNVGRWERGVTLPGPYYRQKLCEVFEKSAQELGLVSEKIESAPAADVPLNHLPISLAQEDRASYWNVPYNRNLLFTGREDILIQLRTALIAEDQPIAICQPQAIGGLGGIGKTQIAVEYAYRYRDGYDAIFWARADSADLLISDFLLIAALLNLPQRNEHDQSVVVKAVLHWFDIHEKWLLILDNADHLEIVSKFMPSAGKGHILLTTRAHSTGTLAQRIELDTMGLEEGTLFLLRRAKLLKGKASSLKTVLEAVRNQAQAIVEEVDGLPLALDQAGAYIEETGCSLTDYLKFYKTRRSRLLRMRGRSASGHPEPVATTWSLSFEKVELANPAAAELLRLCAFLHPDEIPEAMIVEGASELGPILQPVVEDELELNEAIGELRKYSLMKRDPELKLLNIHRLVQAVIKDAMSKETQLKWTERIVKVMSCAFPEEDFVAWPTCQQCLPHTQVCAALIKEWEISFPEATQLLNRAGSYLRKRGQYAEAEAFLLQALKIREKTLGAEHTSVAETLNDLARLYRDQGRYTYAESLLQRALGIREKIFGPVDPHVAESVNILAELNDYQGRYAQAELLYQRALMIQEQTLGSEHPDVVLSLNNLAWLCREQGKYSQAEALSQRALAICEQTRGSDHPDAATSISYLAALYCDQGKYAQAEPLLQRALAIHEQVLGPEHTEVSDDLNNLAYVYDLQGKYAQAEPLFRQALTIKEKVLPEHPDTGYILGNMGQLYRNQGKYEQAEPLLQQALAIHEQVLGPEHPYVATDLNKLALLYKEQGKYTQAELLYQRGLAIREQAVGPEHPKVAEILENYADLLQMTGRESEAAALEERVQAIRARQK